MNKAQQNAVAILTERLERQLRIAVKHGMFWDEGISVSAVLAAIVNLPEYQDVKKQVVADMGRVSLYDNKVIIVWNTHDVISRVKDCYESSMTEAEALAVLDWVFHNFHDYTGINTGEIDQGIEYVRKYEVAIEAALKKGGSDE